MKTIITGNIELIVNELRTGKVAAIPTETVYGLAANALDEIAVASVYEIKNRPKFNPIIVHIKDADSLRSYAEDIDEKVFELAGRFSPGPLTYVLRKRSIIPDIVTAGNEGVGLRISSHPVLKSLLDMTGFPLAAPSANMFGKVSPTSAREVMDDLNGKVSYILDGGNCEVGIESTVISFMDKVPVILRHGGVTREEIEEVIGYVETGNSKKILSPGMLESHYAPSKPLFITEDDITPEHLSKLDAGYLDLKKYADLKTAAVNLFSELRALDKSYCSVILCNLVENKGLGVAINDRLIRASSGNIKLEKGKPETSEVKHA